MIQRIQTVYLILVIAALTVANFWGYFFELVSDSSRFHFNAQGISTYSIDNTSLIHHESIPFFITLIALIVLCVAVIFSFKKIRRQLLLSKYLFLAYTFMLLAIVCWYYFFAPDQITGIIIHQNYAQAFYVLIMGLPFTFLAYQAIRKDKNTLDSLNRLR